MKESKSDFYFFWKWQYTKRSDHISVRHEEIIGGYNTMPGPDCIYRRLGIFSYYKRENDNANYDNPSSSDILKDLIDHNLKYIYPPVNIELHSAFRLSDLYEGFQIFDEISVRENNRIYRSNVTNAIEEHGYLVVINPNENIQDVISDIIRIHTGDNTSQVEGYINKRMCRSSNSDAPRAIGLWIWDSIVSKHGKGPPPHGAITEARKELKERFDISKLGYAESNPRVIDNMYYSTQNCINKCEFLPFGPVKKNTE